MEIITTTKINLSSTELAEVFAKKLGLEKAWELIQKPIKCDFDEDYTCKIEGDKVVLYEIEKGGGYILRKSVTLEPDDMELLKAILLLKKSLPGQIGFQA